MKTGIRQEAKGNSKKVKVCGFTGFALCALLLALCISAEAQQPKKIPRIGFLSGATLPLTRTARGIPAGFARARVRGGEKHFH